MKLVQWTGKGVRGVPDGTCSFAVGPPGVTLITGGIGAGKTSLLRAIAAARRAVEPFESPPDGRDLMRDHGEPGLLRADWAHDGHRWLVDWHLGEGKRPEVPAPAQAMLGSPDRADMGFEWMTSRRSIGVHPALPIFAASRASDRTSRYSDADDKYQGMWRHLSDSVTGSAAQIAGSAEARGVVFRGQLPDGLSAQKRSFSELCPGLRLHSVEPRERLRPLVWFQRSDGKRIEVAALSDGELQAFLFAGVFAWLDLRHSLVLIDTPELHIHPSDHVRFFRALCALGTDNQIIAATTSPAILASVAPAQIIDLSKPQERAV